MPDTPTIKGRDVSEFTAELSDPTAAMFTHLDGETGELNNICVSSLEKDPRVRGGTIQQVPVDQTFAEYCSSNRGIEDHRLARLMAVDHPDPILVLIWPGGTPIVEDGHHRYVAAAIRGRKPLRARIIPIRDWQRHVMLNRPEDVAKDRLTSIPGIG